MASISRINGGAFYPDIEGGNKMRHGDPGIHQQQSINHILNFPPKASYLTRTWSCGSPMSIHHYQVALPCLSTTLKWRPHVSPSLSSGSPMSLRHSKVAPLCLSVTLKWRPMSLYHSQVAPPYLSMTLKWLPLSLHHWQVAPHVSPSLSSGAPISLHHLII